MISINSFLKLSGVGQITNSSFQIAYFNVLLENLSPLFSILSTVHHEFHWIRDSKQVDNLSNSFQLKYFINWFFVSIDFLKVTFMQESQSQNDIDIFLSFQKSYCFCFVTEIKNNVLMMICHLDNKFRTKSVIVHICT